MTMGTRLGNSCGNSFEIPNDAHRSLYMKDSLVLG